MVRDGDEELAGSSCPSRPSVKRGVGGKAAGEGTAGKQESQVSTEQKHKIKIQRSGGPSSFADDRS